MLAFSGRAEHHEAEFRLRARGDRWVWLHAMGRVVERDPQGNAVRLAGTHSDITERKAAEARLRTLAEIDTLTGLPNRAVFVDRLRQTLASRHAESVDVAAVLFIDIDHFKVVNDTFGHSTGDQLLVDFAKCLRACVGDRDVVARLVGDEFTIILKGRQSRPRWPRRRPTGRKHPAHTDREFALGGRVVEHRHRAARVGRF